LRSVTHPALAPTRSKLSRPGAIAQLGERLLCTQEVVGSIPSGSTNEHPAKRCVCFVMLAANSQVELEIGHHLARRIASVVTTDDPMRESCDPHPGIGLAQSLATRHRPLILSPRRTPGPRWCR
jgi:hypothetical protein